MASPRPLHIKLQLEMSTVQTIEELRRDYDHAMASYRQADARYQQHMEDEKRWWIRYIRKLSCFKRNVMGMMLTNVRQTWWLRVFESVRKLREKERSLGLDETPEPDGGDRKIKLCECCVVHPDRLRAVQSQLPRTSL
jgi:hypothetical protein